MFTLVVGCTTIIMTNITSHCSLPPSLSIHWYYICYSTGEAALEDLVPYSEEDLTLFSPNPQLDSNQLFIDNFLTVSSFID